MNKNTTLTLILIIALLVSLSINLNYVKADSNEPISFSSGVTIFSPVNMTYYSRFLVLNLTYGVGLGINCSMIYSIDGKYGGSVPLVAQNPEEMHIINPVVGVVNLPELSVGSHSLNVYTECNTYYIASWSDTVYFKVSSSSGSPSPSIEPSPSVAPSPAPTSLPTQTPNQGNSQNASFLSTREFPIAITLVVLLAAGAILGMVLRRRRR
ncbi:MAG: hypothetical protein ABSA75_14350 [Candidatus Bathyarchaeia archaeon]|jgi:hypothetical protein